MSVHELVELFNQCSSFLPSAIDVDEFYRDALVVEPSVTVAKIKGVPGFDQYAPIIRSVISDMSDDEVYEALIAYLEIYYPIMIDDIWPDDAKIKLLSQILLPVITGIRGV